MDDEDLKTRRTVVEELRKSSKICDQFDMIFTTYSDWIGRISDSDWAEYVIKCGLLERARTQSSSALETDPRTASLQSELTELYRKKEQNDQQLIETNNRLGATLQELSAVKILYDQTVKENQKLKKALKEKTEEIRLLEEANQTLKDEHFALQTSYSSLEGKCRLAQDERNQLIDRIKEMKEKEVKFFNEQNEKAQEERRRRLQKDIESAVSTSHVAEDKTFVIINPFRDQTSEIIGDIAPSICKTKLDFGAEVNDLVWHPEGELFAAVGSDRKVRIYKYFTGKIDLTATLTGSNDALSSLDFSAETGHILAAGSDCAVRVWDVTSRVVKYCLTGHGNKVSAARFFWGGSHVVSGSHDRTFKLWDLKAGKCTKTFFIGSLILDVAVNDQYRMVATGHHDQKIRFWDTRIVDPVKAVDLFGKVNGLIYSPDTNSILASSRDETLSLIDLRTYQPIHTYSADQYRTSCDHNRVAISPGMDYIAAGSADGHIFIFNLQSTKVEKTLYKGGHERGVHSISWHPKGNILVSADRMRTICLWTS